MAAAYIMYHFRHTPISMVDVKLASKPIRLEAGKPATLVTSTVPKENHAYLDKGKDGTFIPIRMDLSTLDKAGTHGTLYTIRSGGQG